MLIDDHREKLENLIIYFVQNTEYCNRTKLFKLLFFTDFYHFKATGQSITGLKYKAWGYGPVPSTLWYEIKKNPEKLKKCILIEENANFKDGEFTPLREFNDLLFTDRELDIMTIVAKIYQDTKGKDMVEETHLPSQPWAKTLDEKGDGETIDYTSVFDGATDEISYEEYRELLKNSKMMKAIFG